MSTATLPVHKWEVGDRALFEYQEVTVDKINKEGRVTSVSYGYGILGGGTLEQRMFPVTEEGKAIAAFYHEKVRHLHDRNGNTIPWNVQGGQRTISLNWPYLSGLIEDKFVATMRLQEAGEKEEVITFLLRAEEFFKQVNKQIDAVLDIKIDGIQLFGR